MDAPRPDSYDMSRYIGMARQHWWIIALLTVLGTLVALGAASIRPKVYESTTYVLVTPSLLAMPTSTTNGGTGARTNGAPDLDTEAQLVTSAKVASSAAKLLKVTSY